jgi:hypothetical protein
MLRLGMPIGRVSHGSRQPCRYERPKTLMEEIFMSHTSKRGTIGRIVAVTGVAAVAAATVAGSLLFANTAGAATSTIVTIKSVSPHLVAALTANQVITVGGTGFDEASITGVTVTGCTAPTYIVTSPTTMVVKTDATCVAAATPVITITDTSSNTAISVSATPAQALSFITAPSIVASTVTVHPVTTDNTALLAYAAQTTAGLSASTKGGTVVRITSGATGYSTSSALPLGASLDGVALTSVKLVGANGVSGNYMTGVVGAHVADSAPVLKITNNGVSKSFPWHAVGASTNTQEFAYGGSTITVTPAFGPSNGTNVITIAGAGFSTTAASDTVTVGGVSCPVSGTPTATTIKCTVAADATPFEGPATVKVVVSGGLTSVISAGSTYTFVAQ